MISTTTTTYTYDNYGNATNISTMVTDNDPGSPYPNEQWTATTVNTILPNPATWCLDLPTQTTVTRSSTTPSRAAITRTVSYPSPDYSNCRQNQQVVEPGNATYQVTTDYQYDTASGNFGNLVKQTVTGIGMSPRVTQYGWTSNGQFLMTVTNPLSQTTTLGFDPNSGMLTSVKDPNNLTTSWQYDSYARKTTEIRPDSTSTTWSYNDCATAGCVNSNNRMTVVQLLHPTTATAILRTDNTYLDALGRPLVMSQQLLNASYNRTEVQYDNLGNVHLQGMPCKFAGCTQYWTTNTYDVLNRLTNSQRPISAGNGALQTTNYTYQGRTTTVTDALSNKTTTIRHVTGDVGRVIDHNGYYLNSNLDAFGSELSTSDSLSNPLSTATYKYGIGPFVVSSTDMDLGNRSYTVDALGEVTAYQDAKGQNFSIFYDLLSRPTSRTEPDLTTTWVWGSSPASYNIGHLQSESAVSSAGTYSETYGYDSLARLHSRSIQLPVQGTASFYYNYNTYTGFLDSLQYPQSTGAQSLLLHYSYAYGALKSIEDYRAQTNHFWVAGNTNPRGQITQETTADLSTDPQIVTNRTYDAVTGWLSSNLTGVGSGGALQNESYLYDLIGNVTQRQNNNAGLTESFYYDNLYRLDHSMLGSTKNLQMAYNAMGNITSRSDIAAGAAWTYDPTHKHEVTQAGSSSFTYTYDANGNAKTRNGTALVWTSYNYPSYLATSTESANFDYGPDRQRWRMIYDSAAGLETTYYATPLFEEVATSTGTDFRHYIYANGRPVVVVSRTTAGATNIRSLLVDHQGSVAAVVADSTGSSYTKESFTAYGNRRDANTWSGAPTSGDRTTMDGVTRQGYTFQTVLGSMGLNHMNGRVEDAITGRFLSADPNIPGPGNTQSYNRYSYVNNNPLSMTDPTGFAGEDARQAARQERHDANERWQWANAKLLWQMAEAGQLGSQTLGSPDFACGFCRMAAQFGLTNQIAAPGRAWGKLSTPPMLPGGSGTAGGSGGSGAPNGTGTSYGCDSQGSICEDTSLNTIPYNPAVAAATSQEAPASMIQQSGYFDLSGMNISMGRALTQFALSGIGGGAVLAAGTAAVPVIAPAFRGAALGAAMDLSSSIITGVTEVSEAAEAAVQSIEQLGAELRAIELGNPEVAGPELPWGP